MIQNSESEKRVAVGSNTTAFLLKVK